MHRLISTSILLSLPLLVAAGCGESGPSLYPASGVVTYQGNPLAGARVTFVPSGKGAIAMGTTDMEGRYTIKTGASPGVVLGAAAVSVTMLEAAETGLNKDMTPEQMQEMAIAGTLEAAMDKGQTSLIPERYGKADSSGLNVEIKADQAEYNLELKD